MRTNSCRKRWQQSWWSVACLRIGVRRIRIWMWQLQATMVRICISLSVSLVFKATPTKQKPAIAWKDRNSRVRKISWKARPKSWHINTHGLWFRQKLVSWSRRPWAAHKKMNNNHSVANSLAVHGELCKIILWGSRSNSNRSNFKVNRKKCSRMITWT